MDDETIPELVVHEDDEWCLCAMHDTSSRRGIWYRRTAAGVEIRAGREGDDYHLLLPVGVVPDELLTALVDSLGVGAWMLDSYGPVGPYEWPPSDPCCCIDCKSKRHAELLAIRAQRDKPAP